MPVAGNSRFVAAPPAVCPLTAQDLQSKAVAGLLMTCSLSAMLAVWWAWYWHQALVTFLFLGRPVPIYPEVV